MNKGYWVVAYQSVSDDAALKAYGKLAEVAIADNGGSILARTGDAVEAHEAGRHQRTVIVEFSSFARARWAYVSEAYQAALRVLGTAAERDFRIIEGNGGPVQDGG